MQPGEAFNELAAKASESAEAVSEKTSEFASQVRERADETIHSVGEKVSEAGAKLWEKAPAEGVVGQAVGRAAAELESGGEYLANTTSSELVADVASLIRRHPLPALALGACLGLLLGAALRQGVSTFRGRDQEGGHA